MPSAVPYKHRAAPPGSGWAQREFQRVELGITGSVVTTVSPYIVLSGEVGVVDQIYPQGDLRRYGGRVLNADNADAITDCMASVAAIGGAMIVPNGTYLVDTDVTITVPLQFSPGGMLKPTSGTTVTISDYVSAPYSQIFVTPTYSQIFDISDGGVVTGRFQNADIHGEWWGAVSLPDQTAPDDSHAVQNGNALRAAAACLFGNTHVYTGTYTVDTDITHPNTSFTLRSGGATEGGAKGMSTGPAIRIFNFDGCQGPEKRIIGIQATGPATGVTRDSGFYTSNTNGIVFVDCWARGVTYGFELDGSSQICGRGNVLEYCTIGIRWGTGFSDTGRLCTWADSVFYNNTSDVYFGAQSYNGLSMGNSSHIATHNKCYWFDGASDVNVGVVTADGQNPPSTTARERVATVHFDGATNIHVDRVWSRDCQVAVLFEDSPDCVVDSLDSDNADTSLVMAGTSTTRSLVGHARIRNSTIGIDLDTLGSSNVIARPDVQGCTTGVVLASDVGTIEMNDGTVTSNTTDFDLPGILTGFKTRNLTVGVLGDLDPVNGQLTYLYEVVALGRRIMYGDIDPGAGSPVPGSIGDQWMRTSGGTSTTLYVRTSAGWVAK